MKYIKYIDAEKLIAEIYRLVKVNKELKPSRFTEGIAAGYGDILSAITSLQQEQPVVDLEKAALNFGEEIGVPVSYTFMSIASHFYELGLNARKEE